MLHNSYKARKRERVRVVRDWTRVYFKLRSSHGVNRSHKLGAVR